MYYARSRYRPFVSPYADPRVGQTLGDFFDTLLHPGAQPRPPFPEPTPIEQTPLGEQEPLPPTPEEQLANALARDIRTSLARAQAPAGTAPGTPGVPVIVRPRPSSLGPLPGGAGIPILPPPGSAATPPPGTVTPTPGGVESASTLRSIGEFLLLTSPAWGSYLYTRYF